MPSTFEFCLPTGAASVPDHPAWLHEVKHDGYRLRLEREGNRARLISRSGYDQSDRYPRIIEAARKNRYRQFDILALDGDDLRRLPLSLRKQKLARLLFRLSMGAASSSLDYEQGEIGPDLFLAACNMGLEGLVSKRADRPYRAGRSKDWSKIKNRKHPAYQWVKDQFQGVYS